MAEQRDEDDSYISDADLEPHERKQHRILWSDRIYARRKQVERWSQNRIYFTYISAAGILAALVQAVKQMWIK